MSKAEGPAAQPKAADSTRQTRNRAATEAEILAAALRLLKRDGVLAGLNLREVADEAGVNRGLIYQYYGSRAQLLREAILQLGWGAHPVFSVGQSQPFVDRRQEIFKEALHRMEAVRLMALVALDGAEDESLFPNLAETRKSITRDQASGRMTTQVDGLTAHLLSVATYFGYATLRDAFARESRIDPTILDERAVEAYDAMLQGFRGSRQRTGSCCCTHACKAESAVFAEEPDSVPLEEER